MSIKNDKIPISSSIRSAWIIPLDYSRRALSLDNDQSLTNKFDFNENKIIKTGLLLAGSGLLDNRKKTCYSFKLKSKNLSTDNVIQRPITSKFYAFNDKKMPDSHIVNELFTELLKDETFFWGFVKQNLQNMSERKGGVEG